MVARREKTRTPAPTPQRWVVFASALPALFSLIWPGDVPWINDEPTFVWLALEANAQGRLASQGLPGEGISYGPVAVWFYQLGVAITHDPVLLAWLHALVMSVAVTAAVVRLGKHTHLWPWFAPVLLLSPYVWFYNRLLWDNTLNISLRRKGGRGIDPAASL